MHAWAVLRPSRCFGIARSALAPTSTAVWRCTAPLRRLHTAATERTEPTVDDQKDALNRAGEVIARADALVVTTGAGMGVDSGLPDFRSPGGFWRSFPPAQKLGLSFEEMANPEWFHRAPDIAWGFYGARVNAYRNVTHHQGYHILLKWFRAKEQLVSRSGYSPLLAAGAWSPYHIFTSNVDGAFQRAFHACEWEHRPSPLPLGNRRGLSPPGQVDTAAPWAHETLAHAVCEIHGSIHHLQCTTGCSASWKDSVFGDGIWPMPDADIKVDPHTWSVAAEDQPKCRGCGGVARPNILMFGDSHWRPERTEVQQLGLDNWLHTLRLRTSGAPKLAIVELGAGRAISTVRTMSERLAREFTAPLVRINRSAGDAKLPSELARPGAPHVSLCLGALRALSELDTRVQRGHSDRLVGDTQSDEDLW